LLLTAVPLLADLAPIWWTDEQSHAKEIQSIVLSTA